MVFVREFVCMLDVCMSHLRLGGGGVCVRVHVFVFVCVFDMD